MTIIGMGNPEMGDDGIGVHLLERLQGEIEGGTWAAPRAEGLALVSAGNDPVAAAACLVDGEPAFIIDAVDMKAAPGEFRVFSPEEAEFARCAPGCSTHTLALRDALSMAGALGAGRIRIMGIQIGDARPGRGLSARLSRCVSDMIAKIKEEVELLS